MSLSTIMNLQITVESKAPTRAGFGTPLLFGYHTAWLGDLVREYADADDMLEDGFTTDDDLYKAARIVKSQDLSPRTFKIGRRVAALTQVIRITPTITTEGFVYKGTVGGKALSYVVLAGATTTTIATALAAAINALVTGSTAANAGSGVVTSSVAGPYALTSGDTIIITTDLGGPTTTTLTGTQASRESAAETFNLDDAMTLTVAIDGGATQTIVFATANFVDINAATAEEVAAVINAGIIGARATVTSGGTKVTITSDRGGTGSSVNVTGGTANAVLTFTTGATAGTGNVSNIAAVTVAELKTAIELAVTGVTVSSAGGYTRITRNTVGASSSVQVTSASTADDEIGFDNAAHTGAAAGATITCTADDDGVVVDYNLQLGMELEDATEDASTGDELASVAGEDSDWYGLLIVDSSSKATGIEAAGWIESVRKICVLQTPDDDARDADVTDDILSALDPYGRTGGIYHRAIGGTEWLAAGWLAGALVPDPGAATMAFKTVNGVSFDRLTAGQESAILAKNGSHYTKTGGINITFEGKSGAGDYLDTVRFIDWLYARLQERVIFVLANNPKIPYTDAGVDVMRSAISAVLQQGITAGGLAADPAPTVTAPLVKDVDPALRIARTLPDVKFTANLAGAIHRLDPVRGTISV